MPCKCIEQNDQQSQDHYQQSIPAIPRRENRGLFVNRHGGEDRDNIETRTAIFDTGQWASLALDIFQQKKHPCPMDRGVLIQTDNYWS